MNELSTDALSEIPQAFYDVHIFVCNNERREGHPRGCCKDKGSVELRTYMKNKAKDMGLDNIRVNSAGCLDRCELGPAMVIYPQGIWYTYTTTQDIDDILQGQFIDGTLVHRLLLKPDDH
jgi:(2Fe-2S) ferredoxin